MKRSSLKTRAAAGLILLLACVLLTACGNEPASEGLEYVVNVEETTHPSTGDVDLPDPGTTVPEKYKNKTCTVTGLGSCTDTVVVIPSTIDGYTVTGIGPGLLEDHPEVASIQLPESVSSIQPTAFSGCPALMTISVSRINTFYYVKDGCLIETTTGTLLCGVGSCSLPSDGSIECIADGALSGNVALTKLTIPDSVTSIGSGVFSGCTALKSVTLPVSVISIGSGVFSGCTALESVTFQGNVRIGEYTFNACTALKRVSFEGNDIYIDSSAFGGCESLTDISFAECTLYISEKALHGCSSLSSISLPAGTRYIGKRAFGNALTDIYYGGTMLEWDGINKDKKWSGLAEGGPTIHCSDGEIGQIYTDASGLIYRINADNSSCTITGLASASDNYDVNSGIVSGLNIGKVTLVIPDTLAGLRVTDIDTNAFYERTDIISVTLPGSINTIGVYAFYGCTALESIMLPASVTSIGGGAFEGCTALESIALPASVTSIGSSAFEGCTGLTSFSFPDGLQTISGYVLRGCTKLSSVDIPASVQNIYDNAFSDCPALTDISYAGSVSQWRRVTRRYNWCKNSPCTIHCSDGDGEIVSEEG